MSGKIRFSQEDLAFFSQASGDRNPLHVSWEYARATPYGQPVVFGCLAALACLRQIPIAAGWRVAALDLEFLRPVFLAIDYRVEVAGAGPEWKARLFDGSLRVLALTVMTVPTTVEPTASSPTAACFERQEALLRDPESIGPGLEIAGHYASAPSAFGDGPPLASKLLAWASYVVGMELPGESALFSRLKLEIQADEGGSQPWGYNACVRAIDPRLGQIQMDVAVAGIASGQFWAYVRPPVPPLGDMCDGDARTASLAGKVAVVIGASRGLGAAIAQAMERRGAIVYSLSRSVCAASSRAEEGDGADSAAVQRLRNRVIAEQGRLDFLVCNACPPILPLRLEPNARDRVAAYIESAVALTLTPLCEFLEPLNANRGTVVIVSSAAVERPVREWPHYVAAKQAVEALANVAVMQYGKVAALIVRPEKLLTTLTNTPMGALEATPPAVCAIRIVRRLESPLQSGRAEILG